MRSDRSYVFIGPLSIERSKEEKKKYKASLKKEVKLFLARLALIEELEDHIKAPKRSAAWTASEYKFHRPAEAPSANERIRSSL